MNTPATDPRPRVIALIATVVAGCGVLRAAMAGGLQGVLTVDGGPPMPFKIDGTPLGNGAYSYSSLLLDGLYIVQISAEGVDGSAGSCFPPRLNGGVVIQNLGVSAQFVLELTQPVMGPPSAAVVALASVGGSITASNVAGAAGSIGAAPIVTGEIDGLTVFEAYAATQVITQPFGSFSLDPECSVDPVDYFPPPAIGLALQYSVVIPSAHQVGFAAVLTTPVANIGDLDGNGFIDGADLGALLSQWGGCGAADLDYTGVVNGADLGLMLANWGTASK